MGGRKGKNGGKGKGKEREKEGERRGGRGRERRGGENDLTHPLSQIHGCATADTYTYYNETEVELVPLISELAQLLNSSRLSSIDKISISNSIDELHECIVGALC